MADINVNWDIAVFQRGGLYIIPLEQFDIGQTQGFLLAVTYLIHALAHGCLGRHLAHMECVAVELLIVVGFMDGFKVRITAQDTYQHCFENIAVFILFRGL